MAEKPQENIAPETKVKYRITIVEFAAMLVFAILFDIIGLIPGTNVVVIFLAQCLFTLVFWANGVSIWKGKKLVATAITSVVEAIPGFSLLPVITAQVAINTLISRAEDKLGAVTQGQINLKNV